MTPDQIRTRINDITAKMIVGVESAEYHALHAERIILRRELRILEEGK